MKGVLANCCLQSLIFTNQSDGEEANKTKEKFDDFSKFYLQRHKTQPGQKATGSFPKLLKGSSRQMSILEHPLRASTCKRRKNSLIISLIPFVLVQDHFSLETSMTKVGKKKKFPVLRRWQKRIGFRTVMIMMMKMMVSQN